MSKRTIDQISQAHWDKQNPEAAIKDMKYNLAKISGASGIKNMSNDDIERAKITAEGMAAFKAENPDWDSDDDQEAAAERRLEQDETEGQTKPLTEKARADLRTFWQRPSQWSDSRLAGEAADRTRRPSS